MSQEKPKTYTAEFRESAAKLANESEKSIVGTAKELGVNVNTLHTWIGKYSRPQSTDKTVWIDELSPRRINTPKERKCPVGRGA